MFVSVKVLSAAIAPSANLCGRAIHASSHHTEWHYPFLTFHALQSIPVKPGGWHDKTPRRVSVMRQKRDLRMILPKKPVRYGYRCHGYNALRQHCKGKEYFYQVVVLSD